jgi:hypothetical protein
MTGPAFDALLPVGLLVMPVGVILFGLAMRHDPAFGKVGGNVSLALGIVGLGAATIMRSIRSLRSPH